ncbi:alpha/beta fold hydrolase [Dactylosporangium siamense]|uniref:alpha/beta fold hydrolase n=1 Tax=Dactylosporangium siamense TaxID=685454 RepID=UPI00194248CA|nr:alpha/beta fold hydrolase [Dactylosporangium siamense]
MTTLLFVHGTGVREPAYGVTFRRFAERIARIRPDAVVAECYWGELHGSRLHAGGVTIPAGTSSRGPDGPGGAEDEDVEVALWGVLERDPLFELRLAATDSQSADDDEELPPHALPAGQVFAAAALRLPANPAVAEAAAAAHLDDVLLDAIQSVVRSDEAGEALRHADALGGELRGALARAVVAESLLCADEELGGTAPVDGRRRDALVTAIVAGLGGSDRGVGGALGRFGANLALKLGVTRPVERRRVAITEASAPAAGDVMLYLARGGGIRDFIAEQVAAVESGPVVLVAHSLGGIAGLELLISQSLPQVELLVTVGSQAPYLYELNALPTLPYNTGLPGSVPRWVNVYDRRDLLSFTGEGVFPGRVEDRVVDNRAPFPRSHSAYFTADPFYAVLDEVLP